MAATGQESGPADWLFVIAFGRNPRRTLVRIIILVVTCVVVFKFVLVPIRVQGLSMMPTYRENRINFVNRLAFRGHGPQRGDVVAIRFAGERIMLMKRVVGLPGDTVGFHRGRLIVNGSVVNEPYVTLPCSWEHEPEKVGPDEYYVVGDNRSMGWSDHVKGKAARNRIVGKVLL